MNRIGWVVCAGTLAGLAAWAGPAGGEPDREAAARAEHQAKRREMLAEAGKRHVELGIWCRDAGLVAQAGAEFLRASEVAEGHLPWADRILALMRSLGDRFWKKVMKRPGPAYLRTYRKKADAVRDAVQKDRLRLAAWAARKGLEAEALTEYVALLRHEDEPIQTGPDGRVRVRNDAIPEPYSQRILDAAVTINERRYVRDEFLELVPEVTDVSEVTSEALRVRTQRGPAEAARLHALLTALLPVIEEDLGGSPTERLTVFVFAAGAAYGAWLDQAGIADHKAAAGVAVNGRRVAVINGEGLGPDAVDAVAMHELAHLFFFGLTRAVMPSWYAEGFAETYGGDGTFRFEGGRLEARRMLAAGEVAPLKTAAGYIPLDDLLGGDALALIQADRSRASSFYAQSWAWLRYLRHHAGEEAAERLAQWETLCFGKALGAKAGEPMRRDAGDSGALFRTLFGPHLAALEAGFKEWLAGL